MKDEDLPDNRPACEQGQTRPARLPVDLVDLPLDAEAFYLVHHTLYHAYAEAQLGNRQAAEEVVHRVFAEILADWERLLKEGNLEQRAWSVLRRLVQQQLEDKNELPAYLVNGPVARVLRAARDQLAVMHSSCGVYAAIAQLPPRQCDVIVLRHVLGYDTKTAAAFMGLDERTVDYHHRRARERLRVALHLPADPPKEPKDPKEGAP